MSGIVNKAGARSGVVGKFSGTGETTFLRSYQTSSDNPHSSPWRMDQAFAQYPSYNHFLITFNNICPTISHPTYSDMFVRLRSGTTGSESTYTGAISYNRLQMHGTHGNPLDGYRQNDSSGGTIRFHYAGVFGGNNNYGGFSRLYLYNMKGQDPLGNTGRGMKWFMIDVVGRNNDPYTYGGRTWGHIDSTAVMTGFETLFEGHTIRGANNPKIVMYGINNTN